MQLTPEEDLQVAEKPSRLRWAKTPSQLCKGPKSDDSLEDVPCHTQAVEQRIGDVTKVSQNYLAGDRLEEEMSNKIVSTEIMPSRDER